MFHEPAPENDSDAGRGIEILARLRDRLISDPIVQEENNEILRAIALESDGGGSWSDLFRDGGNQGHRRFFLALGIQFMQQTSGINIVSYYAPTIFQSVLGMTQERALFVGGFLQVWYLLASFLTVSFFAFYFYSCLSLFPYFPIPLPYLKKLTSLCLCSGT